MNNPAAKQLLTECESELADIKALISKAGPFDVSIPYLTNYALIKVSGTIEQSFKTIIADKCENNQSPQIKTYIQNSFRLNSRNPSYDNICRSLEEFDHSWNDMFKKRISSKRNATKLKTSIKSLNEARNEFAHGGNPTVSFDSIVNYFKDSYAILIVLDAVVI